MTTRLSDDREYQQMTVEEADALFARLAVIGAAIDRSAAETEKRIAELKAAHEKRVEANREEYGDLVERLTRYVNAHHSRFVKPRQRQTPFGKYGLRTVTDVRITDETLVMDFSDKRELALYSTVRKVDKAAVGKAIEQYGEVPGAAIVSGSVASYTVDKKVLDQTKSGGMA